MGNRSSSNDQRGAKEDDVQNPPPIDVTNLPRGVAKIVDIDSSELIASMPWYDLPDIKHATDQFWLVVSNHLRRNGIPGVPSTLDRSTPISQQWRNPRLLLTQACGYNVVNDCAGWLRVLATPCFTAPGCTPGHYRSLILVREDDSIEKLADLRGKVCALNSVSSHSGSNSLLRLIAPFRVDGGFFGSLKVTGAHVNSVRAIKAKEADVAAIDCVTFELLKRHRPDTLDGLRTIATTEEAPAPPYVTRRTADRDLVERISSALSAAFEDPAGKSAREDMLLGGIVQLSLETYDALCRGGGNSNGRHG
jgi:ABC-type phosphate/phosphonate transport system substrate-binding protein